MSITFSLILFFVEFYILIKGAKILIDGAVSIVRIFNISNWFIEVVIVGIGTSIPELSINIASVFDGNTIGLSTIIGSNTFNILFILGISAIFYPILMKKEWILKDFIFNIIAVIISALFIIYPIFGDKDFLGVTRQEGLFLLFIFVLWLLFVFFRKYDEGKEIDYKIFSVITSFICIYIYLW